jgi:hypothetical protein
LPLFFAAFGAFADAADFVGFVGFAALWLPGDFAALAALTGAFAA